MKVNIGFSATFSANLTQNCYFRDHGGTGSRRHEMRVVYFNTGIAGFCQFVLVSRERGWDKELSSF